MLIGYMSCSRPKCYFDISVDGEIIGKIVFELFVDVCPKTCENFVKLCTGACGIGLTSGKRLCYQGSSFHRIVSGLLVQGGDITKGDGTGGESIYGGIFSDENFHLLHDRPFLLSMANKGPNSNGSQFFITTKQASYLDKKHVVFGHVLKGEFVINAIENVPVENQTFKPLKSVIIARCGEMTEGEFKLLSFTNDQSMHRDNALSDDGEISCPSSSPLRKEDLIPPVEDNHQVMQNKSDPIGITPILDTKIISRKRKVKNERQESILEEGEMTSSGSDTERVPLVPTPTKNQGRGYNSELHQEESGSNERLSNSKSSRHYSRNSQNNKSREISKPYHRDSNSRSGSKHTSYFQNSSRPYGSRERETSPRGKSLFQNRRHGYDKQRSPDYTTNNRSDYKRSTAKDDPPRFASSKNKDSDNRYRRTATHSDNVNNKSHQENITRERSSPPTKTQFSKLSSIDESSKSIYFQSSTTKEQKTTPEIKNSPSSSSKSKQETNGNSRYKSGEKLSSSNSQEIRGSSISGNDQEKKFSSQKEEQLIQDVVGGNNLIRSSQIPKSYKTPLSFSINDEEENEEENGSILKPSALSSADPLKEFPQQNQSGGNLFNPSHETKSTSISSTVKSSVIDNELDKLFWNVLDRQSSSVCLIQAMGDISGEKAPQMVNKPLPGSPKGIDMDVVTEDIAPVDAHSIDNDNHCSISIKQEVQNVPLKNNPLSLLSSSSCEDDDYVDTSPYPQLAMTSPISSSFTAATTATIKKHSSGENLLHASPVTVNLLSSSLRPQVTFPLTSGMSPAQTSAIVSNPAFRPFSLKTSKFTALPNVSSLQKFNSYSRSSSSFYSSSTSSTTTSSRRPSGSGISSPRNGTRSPPKPSRKSTTAEPTISSQDNSGEKSNTSKSNHPSSSLTVNTKPQTNSPRKRDSCVWNNGSSKDDAYLRKVPIKKPKTRDGLTGTLSDLWLHIPPASSINVLSSRSSPGHFSKQSSKKNDNDDGCSRSPSPAQRRAERHNHHRHWQRAVDERGGCSPGTQHRNAFRHRENCRRQRHGVPAAGSNLNNSVTSSNSGTLSLSCSDYHGRSRRETSYFSSRRGNKHGALDARRRTASPVSSQRAQSHSTQQLSSSRHGSSSSSSSSRGTYSSYSSSTSSSSSSSSLSSASTYSSGNSKSSGSCR